MNVRVEIIGVAILVVGAMALTACSFGEPEQTVVVVT